MLEFEVSQTYLSQLTCKCPVCKTCYSVFTHPGPGISRLVTRMPRLFASSSAMPVTGSRRAVANHHSKSHGRASTPRRAVQAAGSFNCEFCDERFPSKWSVSQHVRNQHASEASDRRTTEAAQRPTRQWLDLEDLLFLEALKEHGPSSNVVIARVIGTKTAKQVDIHKRIFLRDHPNWLESLQNEETQNEGSSTLPSNAEVHPVSPPPVPSVNLLAHLPPLLTQLIVVCMQSLDPDATISDADPPLPIVNTSLMDRFNTVLTELRCPVPEALSVPPPTRRDQEVSLLLSPISNHCFPCPPTGSPGMQFDQGLPSMEPSSKSGPGLNPEAAPFVPEGVSSKPKTPRSRGHSWWTS